MQRPPGVLPHFALTALTSRMRDVVALEIALTFHVPLYLSIIISALDTPAFEGSDPNAGPPVATRATISTSLQTSWPRTFALLRQICGTLWYGDVLDYIKLVMLRYPLLIKLGNEKSPH